MSEQSANRPLTSNAVTYKTLGGYEVIEFVERTVRAPVAGEVRIEVKAAAVNPADLMFRDPGWPNMTSNIVPGMDAPRSHRIGRAKRIALTSRPEGDCGSQSSALRRRRAGAAPRGARCLGRSGA